MAQRREPTFAYSYGRLAYDLARRGIWRDSLVADLSGEAAPPACIFQGRALRQEHVISTAEAAVILTSQVTRLTGAHGESGQLERTSSVAFEVELRYALGAGKHNVRFLGRIGSVESVRMDQECRRSRQQPSAPQASTFGLQWYHQQDMHTIPETPCPVGKTGELIVQALSNVVDYREPFEPIIRAVETMPAERPCYDPTEFERLARFALSIPDCADF